MNKTAMQELIDWIDEIDNSVFALSAPENELQMLKQFNYGKQKRRLATGR